MSMARIPSDALSSLPPTTNTHLITNEFELVAPVTLEEAIEELSRGAASVLAGGTDLLIQMKLERHRPSRVVSLARVAGLGRIEVSSDGVAVGAMATIQQLASHRDVRERYPVLAEACRSFSTAAIMVMGTIGGNVCNASPASDTAPALLVLDAVADLVGPRGARQVPLHDFFTGPGRTLLSGDEILRSLSLPTDAAGSGSAFIKIARVEADISKVSAAVRLVRDGDLVRDVRIALGSVAPTPMRVREAEATLEGARLTAEAIAEAERIVARSIAPITDQRSTADYRRQVAAVIAGDAVRKAWERAGGAL